MQRLRRSNWKRVHNIDKMLALGGSVFFCLTAIHFIFSTRWLYLITSIFGLGACLVWLFLRNKEIHLYSESKSQNIFFHLCLIYVLLFLITIIIVLTRQDIYVRPLSYFIIISLMASIIGLEVLFSKKEHYPCILLQIILLGFNLYLTQITIFSGVIGVDPWFHQMFSIKIINEGYIPGGFSYSQLPIFHLLISLTTTISNLSYKYSSSLSIGSLQLFVNILIVFLLGKHLFNEKVGLLSGLLLTIANYHLFMGSRPIPNTIACVVILLVLYILIVLRKRNNIVYTLLSLILMLVLIMTHPVASLGMAIILSVCWIISILYNHYNIRYVSFSLLSLFIVAMFGWWMYVSGHITTLSKLIEWGFSLEVFNKTPSEIMTHLQIPFLEDLFRNMAIILFFSFSIIGCLFMLSDKAIKNGASLFAVIGLTPLLIGFFSLITGHAILEERWWYLAQILLAVPVGLAIMLIYSNFNKKTIKVAFLSGTLFVITFIMILNPAANVDNNMFVKNSASLNAVYDSELQSLKTISSVWDGTIGGEGYFGNTVMTFLGYKHIPIDDMLFYGNFDSNNDSIILIREAIIDKTFTLHHIPYRLPYNPKVLLEETYFFKIYACGSVTGYVR